MPKWDGYRAQLARYPGARALLRSRQGTDMTTAFPEVREDALAQLSGDTGPDGELVVWEGGRHSGRTASTYTYGPPERETVPAHPTASCPTKPSPAPPSYRPRLSCR
ncbi:hypothetical protein [Streptomyces sp. 049-1]|uniref:ATP-dependent DNA ligase n=1 Tax=Streptomyces sp. 049-1 TaxID=2789264 RepID=UPI0039807E76